MLTSLRIKDFAIIDQVELDFAPGFTVITGETGTGKSILIDALVVALGGRFSSELIRTGAEAAEVEALFDISRHELIRSRLEERDLVGDDAGILLVRRVVSHRGRGKVVINGRLATLAMLQEVVRGLADISGQHEQLSLLHVEGHVGILDGFGGHGAALAEYEQAHQRWRTLEAERNRLRRGEHDAAARLDFLRFQLDEIDRLAPEAGEDEALRGEQSVLAHADRLQRGAGAAESLLYGDDGSAFDRVGKAASELRALVQYDASLAQVLTDLEGALGVIEDVARTLQRYGSRIESDPERLDAIESRLSDLDRLCRKHGGTLDEVLTRRAGLAVELEQLEGRESRMAVVDAEVADAQRQVAALAHELSEARRAAGAKLSQVILRELRDMELEDAVFDVLVEQGDVGPHGADRVELLWSANPGETPRSLAKIASGGELSRLMLAVKRVQCHQDLVSLYVFDEVDTGLGGKAADAIGRKIQAVAEGHQALTITHLAPIAARADHHLRVTKHVGGGRTQSQVMVVRGEEREEEVARMIDGARITKATREAARAMLDRSIRKVA